jgi:hypothetical protein
MSNGYARSPYTVWSRYAHFNTRGHPSPGGHQQVRTALVGSVSVYVYTTLYTHYSIYTYMHIHIYIYISHVYTVYMFPMVANAPSSLPLLSSTTCVAAAPLSLSLARWPQQRPLLLDACVTVQFYCASPPHRPIVGRPSSDATAVRRQRERCSAFERRVHCFIHPPACALLRAALAGGHQRRVHTGEPRLQGAQPALQVSRCPLLA